jgi:nucleotide-binding universal stress UspA family protein
VLAHLPRLREREERLHERVQRVRERHPAVAVELRVVQDDPRAALRDASREAALLVVGARGRGAFAGLLLGSVSASTVAHARCPVAVVR